LKANYKVPSRLDVFGVMKMDEQIVQQIFDELLSSLEPLDTQNAALLQFLKAKGIATDEELAPFLEQAGNASNVRWLGARVRIRSLISSAMKPAEHIEKESVKSTPKDSEPAAGTSREPSKETAEAKKTEESDVEPKQADADNEKFEKTASKVGHKDDSDRGNENTNSEAEAKKIKAESEGEKENAA
jgi:hypothetical protein